jgi:hypothetical protein
MRKAIADHRAANMRGLAEDTPLWRVFQMRHLLDAVTRKRLVLVKPSLWDDPFENFLSSCRADLVKAGTRPRLGGITDRYFGSCWTRDGKETDATWRLYLPLHRRGARVAAKAGPLFDCIYDHDDPHSLTSAFIGPVTYLAEAAIRAFLASSPAQHVILDSTGQGSAATLLTKRPEFAHESEVRILYRESGKRARYGIRAFPCDPNKVFAEILLDPRLDSTSADAFKVRLQKAGYWGNIGQSRLYRLDPLPTVRIDL